MKKISQKILDILAFAGIALVIIFAILAVHYAYVDNGKPVILYVVPYLTFALGCICFTFNLIYLKKAYQMFISILLIFFGLLFSGDLIFHYGTSISKWWPVLCMITGVAWFASGIYKYKRFNLGFAIPSLVLVVLGCWYMLFSFKIIKIPFTKVVVMLGPVYVLVLMLIMILIYFCQKKNKNFVIQNEEPGVFADEEMVLTDMESNESGE